VEHTVAETSTASSYAPIEIATHAAPVEIPAAVATVETSDLHQRETAALVIGVEIAPAPVAAEPVHAETVRSEPASAFAPSPALAPATAPVADVGKALEDSGLVMIQTDPTKVQAAEPAPERQVAPAQPRPRRPPPPDTGPLEIVETRKEV
jgi:ribonuclease E